MWPNLILWRTDHKANMVKGCRAVSIVAVEGRRLNETLRLLIPDTYTLASSPADSCKIRFKILWADKVVAWESN